jgi:hypothetical protein
VLIGAAVLDQVHRGEWSEERLTALWISTLDKPLARSALFPTALRWGGVVDPRSELRKNHSIFGVIPISFSRELVYSHHKESSQWHAGQPEESNLMLIEKKPLSVEEIEAQTALELPERETPALVIIGCLAVCIGEIRINVEDVNVAAQVCADVTAITLNNVEPLFSCTIRQR